MRGFKFLVILTIIMASINVAQAQYPGTYTGTYSGDESGTWQAIVDDSLNVTGSILSSSGQSRTGTGSVSSTGGFVMGIAEHRLQ